MFTYYKCINTHFTEKEIKELLSDVEKGQTIVGVWKNDGMSYGGEMYHYENTVNFGEFTNFSDLTNLLNSYATEHHFGYKWHTPTAPGDYNSRWVGFRVY